MSCLLNLQHVQTSKMAECFVCDVGDGVDTKMAAEKKKKKETTTSDQTDCLPSGKVLCHVFTKK